MNDDSCASVQVLIDSTIDKNINQLISLSYQSKLKEIETGRGDFDSFENVINDIDSSLSQSDTRQ